VKEGISEKFSMMREKHSTTKGQNMSNLALYRDFHLHGAPVPSLQSAAAPERLGIVRRIFAAIERSHQRRADQEAGRFIAAHGGRLTDDVERQLTEYLGSRGFAP
jgi:hypothetical protein